MTKKSDPATTWKHAFKELNSVKEKNSKESFGKTDLINEVRDLILEWKKTIEEISKESQIQLAINSVFKVFNSTLDRLYKLENLIHQYGEEDRRFYFVSPESKIIKKLKEEVSELLNQSEDETEALFQKNWQILADALAWSVSLVFPDLTSKYPEISFDFSLIGDGSLAFQMLGFEDFLIGLNSILKDIKNIMSEKSAHADSAKIKVIDIVYKLENINDDFDYCESIFEEVFQALEQSCFRIYRSTLRMICRNINEINASKGGEFNANSE